MDSLLLGCIPVLFHVGQAKQWPWHWGSWQANSSVLLEMDAVLKRKLNPLAILRTIPAERIAVMQRTIAAHAHSMQYAAVDTSNIPPLPPMGPQDETAREKSRCHTRGGGVEGAKCGGTRRAAARPPSAPLFIADAFDVSLHHAWRRATDPTIVDAGLVTQRTHGARLDHAIAIFEKEPTTGSWGGRSSGTCSRTWGVEGDCNRGQSGTWRLGADGGNAIVSIDDCAARCKQCASCHWISHSHAHRQCDWYNTCNTSKLRRVFGGETFRTRQVGKGS